MFPKIKHPHKLWDPLNHTKKRFKDKVNTWIHLNEMIRRSEKMKTGKLWILHHPNKEKAGLASSGEVSLVANPRQLTHQQPRHGRHQEEDAVAQVRDGRALQDHFRL